MKDHTAVQIIAIIVLGAIIITGMYASHTVSRCPSDVTLRDIEFADSFCEGRGEVEAVYRISLDSKPKCYLYMKCRGMNEVKMRRDYVE